MFKLMKEPIQRWPDIRRWDMTRMGLALEREIEGVAGLVRLRRAKTSAQLWQSRAGWAKVLPKKLGFQGAWV